MFSPAGATITQKKKKVMPPSVDVVVPICFEEDFDLTSLPRRARIFFYDVCGATALFGDGRPNAFREKLIRKAEAHFNGDALFHDEKVFES